MHDDHAEQRDWAEIITHQEHVLNEAKKLLGITYWTEPMSATTPEWLVPGLLQQEALHVLSSDSGTCKSWLGLSLMLSGIYGIPVLGQAPTKRFSSIYLAADSPSWDIGQQMRKLLLAHNLRPNNDVPNFIMPLGFLFERPDHLQSLGNLVKAFDIDVFFIDVMLYTHTGDENDNAFMARTVLRAAKFLRDELGLAVFFLHHNAKPKPDMPASFRGAGTIVQAAEHHLALSRRRSDIILQAKKIRGEAILPEYLPFTLASTENGGRFLATTTPEPPTVVPTPTHPILEFMKAKGKPVSRQEILLANLSPPDTADKSRWADNQLYQLSKKGQVQNTQEGWTIANLSE
jgi:hypothetical protein